MLLEKKVPHASSTSNYRGPINPDMKGSTYHGEGMIVMVVDSLVMTVYIWWWALCVSFVSFSRRRMLGCSLRS